MKSLIREFDACPKREAAGEDSEERELAANLEEFEQEHERKRNARKCVDSPVEGEDEDEDEDEETMDDVSDEVNPMEELTEEEREDFEKDVRPFKLAIAKVSRCQCGVSARGLTART